MNTEKKKWTEAGDNITIFTFYKFTVKMIRENHPLLNVLSCDPNDMT